MASEHFAGLSEWNLSDVPLVYLCNVWVSTMSQHFFGWVLKLKVDFFSKFKIKIMFSTLLAAYMVLVPLLVYVNVCVVYINLTVMNSFVIQCVLIGQPQSYSTKQTSFIGQVDLLWKSPTYWLPLCCSGRQRDLPLTMVWYLIRSSIPKMSKYGKYGKMMTECMNISHCSHSILVSLSLTHSLSHALSVFLCGPLFLFVTYDSLQNEPATQLINKGKRA